MIRSTPIYWLPVPYIPPWNFRSKFALKREYDKIINMHEDLRDLEWQRPKYRYPPLVTTKQLFETNFDGVSFWQTEWTQKSSPQVQNPSCITQKSPRFELARKTWHVPTEIAQTMTNVGSSETSAVNYHLSCATVMLRNSRYI